MLDPENGILDNGSGSAHDAAGSTVMVGLRIELA
jgi:hypothetical protein